MIESTSKIHIVIQKTTYKKRKTDKREKREREKEKEGKTILQ